MTSQPTPPATPPTRPKRTRTMVHATLPLVMIIGIALVLLLAAGAMMMNLM